MAVPVAPLWFLGQPHTWEVEPLKGTQLIIAGYHVSIRHIIAEAESRLVVLHIWLQHCLTPGLASLQRHASCLLPPLSWLRNWAKCSQQLRVELVWDWLDQRTLNFLEWCPDTQKLIMNENLLDVSFFGLICFNFRHLFRRLRNSIIIEFSKRQYFPRQVNFQGLIFLNFGVISLDKVYDLFMLLDKFVLWKFEVGLFK